MSDDDSGDSALRQALLRVLTPLSRLLIARGVSFRTASEIWKRAYVQAARRDGGGTSVSRISVLTGLQRRDVKAILESPVETGRAPGGPIGRVLATWAGDPRYRGDDGAPVPLPRTTPTDDGLSFERLCQSISQDVHPRAVLDALLAIEAVAFDGETDFVTLQSAALVVKDDALRAGYLGANLGDHAEAAAANMTADPAPYFERAVHYDGLTPASVAELDELARKLNTATLLKLNEQALKLQNRDGGAAHAGMRFRAGAYVFSQEKAKEEDP